MLNIYDFPFEDLKKQLISEGFPPFKTKIIFYYLYKKFVRNFDEMVTAGKSLIQFLKDRFKVGNLEPINTLTGDDDSIKFLFKTCEGYPVESVLMRERGKVTFCLSSQSGCPVGCSFCATGKMGFFRNLTSGEIIEQAAYGGRIAQEIWNSKLNNIVYMGMGEPLLNLNSVIKSLSIITREEGFQISPKKVTISTVGFPEKLMELSERSDVNLAISLHSPDEERRRKLIPVSKKSGNLKELLRFLKVISEKNKRLITIEYLLIKNFNDFMEDIEKLVQILDFRCKINLIPYNPVKGNNYETPDFKRVEKFQRELLKNGILTTVRKSKGIGIGAGCGQLGMDYKKKTLNRSVCK